VVHESAIGTSRRNGQLDFMSGFGRNSEADGCGGFPCCDVNDPNRTIEAPTPTLQFRTIQVCLKDLNRPAATLSVEKSARKGSVACGMQQACPQLRDLTYRALSRRAKFDEM